MGLKKIVADSFSNSISYFSYYHSNISKTKVLFECQRGTDVTGDILQMLLYFSDIKEYQLYLSYDARFKNDIKEKLRLYGCDGAHLVERHTTRYYSVAAKCKYLINDYVFPYKLVKKQGQVYLNLWNETPVFKRGFEVLIGFRTIDDIQRSIFMTDYLMSAEDSAVSCMLDDFNMKELYSGLFINQQRPSIQALVDDRFDNVLLEKVPLLKEKKCYLFIPDLNKEADERQNDFDVLRVRSELDLLEKSLKDDEAVIVCATGRKTRKIDYSQFKRIIACPASIDITHIIHLAYGVIAPIGDPTLAFANHIKNYVIYDQPNSDLYRSHQMRPDCKWTNSLCKVSNVEDALNIVRKNQSTCISMDAACIKNDASEICKSIYYELISENERQIEQQYHSDNKVLMYGGNLNKNGMTTSLRNLLNLIEDERQYYVLYRTNLLNKKKYNLKNVDHNRLIGISGTGYPTAWELLCLVLFTKCNANYRWIKKYYYRFIEREYRKCFCNDHFESMVQFCGYEWYIISLFQMSKANRAIFVHNDMLSEIKTKGNQYINVIRDAYRSYDHVALVADSLYDQIRSLGGNEADISVVENCQDNRNVIRRAQETIRFQKETTGNVTHEDVLEQKLKLYPTVIMTIGRFSPEKQHELLISAFERFADSNEDACLIIIGGYGAEYKNTLQQAKKSVFSDRIIVLKSIDNPYPILKHASLFVLSSLYEGQPVVFFEAAALGIPVLGTDAPGITGFLNKYGGCVVDNSIEGLVSGFERFKEGKIKGLDINFENYNDERIKNFMKLLQ